MRTILVSTFPISQTKGSEFSVGWNYVKEMSKDNRLIVLYGTVDGDFYSFGDFSHVADENIRRNVRFVPVSPSIPASFMNFCFRLDPKGRFVYYFFFRNWQKNALRKAQEIIAAETVDVVHQICPTGFKEPGFLWRLNKPYIWGPVTAVHVRPWRLLKGLPLPKVIASVNRNFLLLSMLRLSPRVHKAAKRADVLIATTSQSQRVFRNILKRDCCHYHENGILSLEQPARIAVIDGRLSMLWIGAFTHNKNLNLLIDTLSEYLADNQQWELHVVGSGEMEERWKRLAERQGLGSRIVWHGQIPRTEVRTLLKQSHLHIITSLGEGTPTTLWEAMECGVPTLSIAHCGMADVVCSNCGIKIPIESLEQVKRDIALNIKMLIENPAEITRLSHGVAECAQKFTWDKRREFFNRQYELAVNNFYKR